MKYYWIILLLIFNGCVAFDKVLKDETRENVTTSQEIEFEENVLEKVYNEDQIIDEVLK